MSQLIPVEDDTAALFAELAAARLRLDHEAMKRLESELADKGYRRTSSAAEKLARAAIDVEREARPPTPRAREE
jgi:hypothetical protein